MEKLKFFIGLLGWTICISSYFLFINDEYVKGTCTVIIGFIMLDYSSRSKQHQQQIYKLKNKKMREDFKGYLICLIIINWKWLKWILIFGIITLFVFAFKGCVETF